MNYSLRAQVSPDLDLWLQDACDWDGSLAQKVEWIVFDQTARSTVVLPDGSETEVIMERGLLPDTCNRDIPERARQKTGGYWGSYRCGLLKHHDCPHVAVGNDGDAYRITSLQIRKKMMVSV